MWPIGAAREYWNAIEKHPSRAIVCIQFLVLSHSYANRAVVSVLITYLTGNWRHQHFNLAAVNAAVVEAVTMMMIIVLCHISDKYCMDHHYKLIIFTSIAYILGLSLLRISLLLNQDIAAWEVYIACLLISLGEAGRSAALKSFLLDQYLSELDQRESTDENILETRLEALWDVPWFFGSLFPLIPVISSRPTILIYSAASIGVSSFFFWWARSNYFIYNGSLVGTYETGQAQMCTTLCPLDEERDQKGDQICQDDTEETSTTSCLVDRAQRRETCIATGGNVSTVQRAQTMDLATIPSPVDEETHQRGRQISAQNTGMPDTHSVMDEAESRGIGTEETPSTKEESLSRAEIHRDIEETTSIEEESLPRAEIHTDTEGNPCAVEESLSRAEIHRDTEETPGTKEESLSRAEIHTDTEGNPCAVEESLSRAEIHTDIEEDPCSAEESLSRAEIHTDTEETPGTKEEPLSRADIHTDTEGNPCPVELEESLSRAEIQTDIEEDPCSTEKSLSRAEVDTDTKRDPCRSIEQAQSTESDEATRVSYPAEQTGRGEVWTLKKLKEELPFFKKMLPMWFPFIIYTMVDAAGSSFFFGQMSNLDDLIGNSAVYFAGLTSFTASVVSFLYKKVKGPKKRRHASLVIIGSAVTCSQLCCFAAWLVEVYRLNSVKSKGLENDNTTIVSMSIFLLVPQFFLLGIMKGLSGEGLVEFFDDQINYGDKLMERYGKHITSFVLGVIRLLTTLNILVPFFVYKKSWFGDNINTSRLDLYFFVLTLCSLVNIGYYLCVAHYYATSRSPKAVGEEQQEQSA